MKFKNRTNRDFAFSSMQLIPYSLILFSCLIFCQNNLQAQVYAVDENQDGAAPILIPSNEVESVTQSVVVLNDCTSIGIIETGEPIGPMERLDNAGYADATFIGANSGLTDFEEFDIIYLPGGWASLNDGDLGTIESNAADYIDYVAQGGSLFVEQPNPYLQSGSVVTPSVLPFPITFYNPYNNDDHPPTVVNPNHEILIGLSPNELSLPLDQMTVIAPEYEVLLTGAVTGNACLVVLEYGLGRIVVCTSNSSPNSISPMSDQYFLRLIQWLGANISVDNIQACESHTWIDGVTYTSNNNTAVYTLSGSDGCDSIVNLNLTINFESTEGVDIVNQCGPFTWIDGITYTESNNTAVFTGTNAGGCDSIISLILTINGPDATITQNGQELTVATPNAAYQWLDCGNNFMQITGANEQSYTVSTNGDYAVMVTLNGCVDTSECISMVMSGVDNPLLEAVSVFPNPSSDGQLTVDLAELNRPTIKVYSVLGQLIFKQEQIEQRLLDFEVGEVAGIYFVEVFDGGDAKTFRVLVD